jgi:hypothetical protein
MREITKVLNVLNGIQAIPFLWIHAASEHRSAK